MSLIIGRDTGGLKHAWFEPEFDTNLGEYRARSLTSNSAENFTFQVPSDFNTLSKLVLIGSANGTIVTQDIDLFSDYALVTELFNTNSEADTITTYSFTANIFTEIDISGVYSVLAADHICGLTVDHNAIGTTINYLGILMEYS